MSSADSGTSTLGLGKEVDRFLGFDEVGKEDVDYSLLRTKVKDDV
jgi:hypothetical protein